MSIEFKEMAQLEKAAEKAKALKPKVRIVKTGEYKVQGERGNWYDVTFTRANGRKLMTCNCAAGSSARPRICYHCASVFPIHTFRVRQEQEAVCAAPAGDDLAGHIAECDDPDCMHIAPTLGPVPSQEPYVPVLPEKPATDAPMIFACNRPATLPERIARDRSHIASLRTRLNLPGPVIPTFASRDEAFAVAASANADLF